ncbi:hypothetical protein N658DRAFT_506884 [Parathielavia hyrcaniae]|uniref:Uncharacterized protein n=1 Tax=Parathielavia hyrcaniae TaxID=113614 RepID=A0AAN6T2C1_9PEZI|nr:hypothetical protein N658DRAFT_506884 [Parathielavia hyrcaniae]
MSARSPLPSGPPPHSPPHRAATADDGGEGSEVMMYALVGEEEEDHVVYSYEDSIADGDVGSDEAEDSDDTDHDDDGADEEDEYDEDEDENEGEETMHGSEHHGLPMPYHYELWPPNPQPYFDESFDPYLSDDLDQSENTGVPLVDYLASHILGDDVAMHDAADSDMEAGLFWPEEAGATSASVNAAAADIAASVQAEAIVAHTQAAAYASIVPPPPTDLAPGNVWTHLYQISVSNPNPTTIGPSNLSLTDFLRHWARQSRILQGMARGSCPWPAKITSLDASKPSSVEYQDLQGDRCDFQGVDWKYIGVTRRDARERRLLTYSNYVNLPGSDRWTPNLPDVALPRSESFFRFRRMDFRQNIHLSHFQLRHVFASASRSRVFYPSIGSVQQFNPLSGHGRAIMRLSDAPASQISTLATGHGVLIAGGFGGDYMLRHLNSAEPEDATCHEGVITSSISGITNHIDIHQARSSSVPLAAFASNDNVLRVLDVNAETWLSQETHDFAPNCTATSPDGRLRVMVGDTLDVVITAAESTRSGSGEPDIMQRLSGHRDYGFACDWADDGWTIATAFQDKTVKIWDARRFTDTAGHAAPVCTIRSEMAGVRSLRFSPVGSGRRVLVAAEEADFVSIIDARTFRSKQTVDVFGELGGISFENAGQDLMVLCCDRTRGGILQLERCGEGWDESAWGEEEVEEEKEQEEQEEEGRQFGRGGSRRPHSKFRRGATRDWPRSVFTEERRFRESAPRRRRRATALDVAMDPF